jgi:hypothetical protein
MYLERKEFINKGASLATICVTQPRYFCPRSPGLALFVSLFGACVYKGSARAVLYRPIPPGSGARDPGPVEIDSFAIELDRGSPTTDPATF